MNPWPENLLNIKQRVIENMQDLFVYCVSMYNFWSWIKAGTYKYFHGWEFYNWVDFLWTMTWQIGSMYLLYRRIMYINNKEAMMDKKEDVVIDAEQTRQLGYYDKIAEYFRQLLKF